MGVTSNGSQMVDISNGGTRIPIDCTDKDYLTVNVPAAALLGSAVFELKRTGSLIAYSPAKTIDTSNPCIIAAEVKSIDEAVLELTTPDATARSVRVEWFGEEEV
jgi:hypothetical protein